MPTKKPSLSFWQIIHMNVGFFGIQYSFGLQQSAVTPVYDFLGASPDEIPWLNLAGPVTGLVVQPLIGALSDKTWSVKYGRRKPYFFIGAIMCSIALFLFPFSSSLWMAAGLLWIMDAGNNTAMEPYRAFIADKLDESQQPTGFQAQSFFTGLGQTLANVSLFVFPLIIAGSTGKIPYWVFGSFTLGAVCSIVSIWWSMKTTTEIEPTAAELAALKSRPLNLFTAVTDIVKAIVTMPKIMKVLALVYLFQWYALFCYWQNSSKAVAQNSFGWTVLNKTPALDSLMESYAQFKKAVAIKIESAGQDASLITKNKIPASQIIQTWRSTVEHKAWSKIEIQKIIDIDANNQKYEKAVSHTGLVNGWYNIVTFLIAFSLVRFAKKYNPKYVHAICLLLAGIGFIAFSFIQQKWLFFAAITGFGVGWASIMGIPYLLVVNSIPKEKYGVYMGIINMMIVIPMLIQTLTFGYVLKHVFHNNPSIAVCFAGVLLLIAAALSLLLNNKTEMNYE
jgi:maltose/moltooligosaccharide transporter